MLNAERSECLQRTQELTEELLRLQGQVAAYQALLNDAGNEGEASGGEAPSDEQRAA